MPNPLYNALGGNQQVPLPGPFGNIQQLAAQFQQFRNNFRGDPRQQVQELLNSGRMSQAQFNQLRQAADQLQGFLR